MNIKNIYFISKTAKKEILNNGGQILPKEVILPNNIRLHHFGSNRNSVQFLLPTQIIICATQTNDGIVLDLIS